MLKPQGGEYDELIERLRKLSAYLRIEGNQSPLVRHRLIKHQEADTVIQAAGAIERLSVGTGLEGELRERPTSESEVLVLGAVEENDERGAIVVFNDGVAQLGKIHAPYSIIRAADAPNEGWVSAGRCLVEQIEKGELTDLFDHQFINNKAFIEFKKLLEQA